MNAELRMGRETAITPRMAVGFMFLCFGLNMGLWGGSVAEVARLGAIPPEIVGTAFVGFAIAGIAGFAMAGRIGKSISLKQRLLGLIALAAICQFILFHIGSPEQLTIWLLLFGLMSSSVDLVMNSEAVAVERDLARPVLSSFHGLASVGVAFGAILGSYLSVSFAPQLTASLSMFLYGLAALAITIGSPDRGPTHSSTDGSSWFRPNWALIAVALVLGASISAETASIMFSAPTLAAQAPELAAYAGFGATGYALMQGGVRLTGDRLRAAFGDDRLIIGSLAIALCGLLVVAASGSVSVTATGFAVVGLGTACIVPCCFASATRISGRSAAASISTISVISGLIRIPSPYIYGLVAGAAGYSAGFAVFALFIAAALMISLAAFLSPRSRRPA